MEVSYFVHLLSISRNIGIISKLRHYLSIKQLRQIYYNLIYPYIAYAILAWGSTYTSSLQKVQAKQNHVVRLIFFANMRGKDTESALPLLSSLDMLPVYNIYSLHVLKFAHLLHKGLLPDVKSHNRTERDSQGVGRDILISKKLFLELCGPCENSFRLPS